MTVLPYENLRGKNLADLMAAVAEADAKLKGGAFKWKQARDSSYLENVETVANRFPHVKDPDGERPQMIRNIFVLGAEMGLGTLVDNAFQLNDEGRAWYARYQTDASAAEIAFGDFVRRAAFAQPDASAELNDAARSILIFHGSSAAPTAPQVPEVPAVPPPVADSHTDEPPPFFSIGAPPLEAVETPPEAPARAIQAAETPVEPSLAVIPETPAALIAAPLPEPPPPPAITPEPKPAPPITPEPKPAPPDDPDKTRPNRPRTEFEAPAGGQSGEAPKPAAGKRSLFGAKQKPTSIVPEGASDTLRFAGDSAAPDASAESVSPPPPEPPAPPKPPSAGFLGNAERKPTAVTPGTRITPPPPAAPFDLKTRKGPRAGGETPTTTPSAGNAPRTPPQAAAPDSRRPVPVQPNTSNDIRFAPKDPEPTAPTPGRRGVVDNRPKGPRARPPQAPGTPSPNEETTIIPIPLPDGRVIEFPLRIYTDLVEEHGTQVALEYIISRYTKTDGGEA